MKKKIIRRTIDDTERSDFSLHPLINRIYKARGINSSLETELVLDALIPYQSMLSIDKAVACIANALIEQESILIVGDFDADGATSSAVAVRALRSFGAQRVNYLVPNRFEFGYGLTPELVKVAQEFSPTLIVTVDNGIANHAGVSAAKELGIKVVITDHHLAGETLPEADAIVNPNQPGDAFPSKNLAGVGVIFYVMLALRRYLTDQNWFNQQNLPEPNMSKLLDLVSLGTVADVVPLDHNNRILVHQGLRRIRAGHCVPGITALLEIAGRNQNRLVATDLGFAVAPRLNAAGRLEDISLGIECLLTDNLDVARTIAKKLNELNEERRQIEHGMQEQAFMALNKSYPEINTDTHGVCLFDEEWHQGVIGIVASRVKDRIHRPVIAFAMVTPDELKGSARSIPGLHIRDALADVATSYPNLINKFGGHAMAAGLTIPRAYFDDFAQAFAQKVSARLKPDMLNNVLLSDGELQSSEISLQIAETIREAGPWGQAFPEPLFDGTFELIDQRLVGGKHLKMVVSKESQLFDAIAFNVDLNHWPNYRCAQITIAYRMDMNEFRGRRSVQLVVEHLEMA